MFAFCPRETYYSHTLSKFFFIVLLAENISALFQIFFALNYKSNNFTGIGNSKAKKDTNIQALASKLGSYFTEEIVNNIKSAKY